MKNMDILITVHVDFFC